MADEILQSPPGSPCSIRAAMIMDGNTIQLVLQQGEVLHESGVQELSVAEAARSAPSPAPASPVPTADAQKECQSKQNFPVERVAVSRDISRPNSELSSARAIFEGEIRSSPVAPTPKSAVALPQARSVGNRQPSSSAANARENSRGAGDHTKYGLDEDDPDAYDVMNLDRLLLYSQDDRFSMKEYSPVVYQQALAHSPLGIRRNARRVQSGPKVMPGAVSSSAGHRPSTSRTEKHEQNPTQSSLGKPAASIPRSGAGSKNESNDVAIKAAPALEITNGMRGKKLQLPPGTMLRRRPSTARTDPLGDELKVHSHLVANTVCHPLLAKKRAAEKAAALEAASIRQKEASDAAKKSSHGWRPSTAHSHNSAEGKKSRSTECGNTRPASAMARMDTSLASDSLRRTFLEHDSRMAAFVQHTVDPVLDMRDKTFFKALEGETPSKQRRATTTSNRILRGILDTATARLDTEREGDKLDVVRMGAEVQPRDHACTIMPPKMPAASSAQLSRTMDARLEAMMGWAERAADSNAADAKLTDWFGKWLKSYEYEQNAFKSAQVYGEVKMCETRHSSSLDRLGAPNRFRTAVVCDMFGRIMPIFGRYRGLMQQIHQELVTAIYTDMKEGGNTFEAIPFFTRCAALSQEVSDLKKERSRLVLDLSEEEERMIEMQRKIREYREEIQSVKLEAAWSRSKQNQMEVNLLSQHFGGDNRDEIIAQNKRLKSDMQTETLLRQASQDRIREMEMEIGMLKIRVKTAEQEWKDSCKAVDELRKELAMAEARNSNDKGSKQRAQVSASSDLSIVDWVNEVLGAPKGKPFLADIEKDLSNCRIYFELIKVVWGSDDEVRRSIEVIKTKRSKNEIADDTANLLCTLLQRKLVDGDMLLSSKSFVHEQVLLELMCTHADLQRAQEESLSVDNMVSAQIRRSTICANISSMYELDAKCSEQANMLKEFLGDVVHDDDLTNHASFKLTSESLQLIFSTVDENLSEGERIEISNQCMQRLNLSGNALRATFHYYCKLAERGVDENEVSGTKQSSYLSGLETMDRDEFAALISAAKLQLPKLEQACTDAFHETIKNITGAGGEGPLVNLGMGFVHFQECLVRLVIHLCPHFSMGAQNMLPFVPEVLQTLTQHISQNCERLQHVEFGALVHAENMATVWSNHMPELKMGFRAYCTEENNTTMGLHDFLRFLKDTKISGARLSVPAMCDIFSCVQEEGSEENSSDTMDYQEFVLAMAACAVYMDPSPFLSLPHKVQEFLTSTLLPAIEVAKNKNKGRIKDKKPIVPKKRK